MGRFVSGVMSAVPSVIVSGSVEDIFGVRQRVWIMFGWACCTTGGLLAGPAYGSYVSAAFGWYEFLTHLSLLGILKAGIKLTRVGFAKLKRFSLTSLQVANVRLGDGCSTPQQSQLLYSR